MKGSRLESTAEPDLPDLSGAILAQGNSLRMGRDKATLRWRGQTFAARIEKTLRTVVHRVLIAGYRPDLASPATPCYPDRYPGSALGGLHTALGNAPTPWVFVVACDMPLLDPGLIRHLAGLCSGARAVIPQGDRGPDPLCGLYHRDCLPMIERQLEAGRYCLQDLLPLLAVCFSDSGRWPAGWRRGLCNINTPEDLSRLKKDT